MEKLAKLKSKQLVIFGLLLTAIYYFLFFDGGSTYDAQLVTLNQKIETEEQTKKKTISTLNKEKEMKVNVETLTKQYLDLTKRVPTSLNSIDISRTIELMARSSGVQVKGKKPKPPIRNNLFEEIPVELALVGSYTELAQFIYFASTSERTLRMGNFTIESQLDSNKLKFEGTLVGYRMDEAKDKASSSLESKEGASDSGTAAPVDGTPGVQQ